MNNKTLVSESLVDFALEVYSCGSKNAEIDLKIKELISDQIGLQLACSQLDWSRSVHRYRTRLASQGRSTILGYGGHHDSESAVFINSAFGHGQDYDDTCLLVQTHPGAVIIPVGIAVGEEMGKSGRQVLNSIIAGYEVMLRVAYATSPGMLIKGHHTPPAAGPFGATITAGLLLGLTREQLIESLGIAGSHAGGLTEYTQSGGSVKRIHCAIGAVSGLRSAYLAREGITGPKKVLEGKRGFINVYSDTPNVERLLEDLGKTWLISEVANKNYNCCYYVHTAIEALKEIFKNNDILPEEIHSIKVGMNRYALTHVGSIPEPSDALGAQFSTHFILPYVIYNGDPNVHSYTEDDLANTDIRELAKKVHVYEDEAAEKQYPHYWENVVTIEMNDGTSYTSRVRDAKGTKDNPMSMDEIWEKNKLNNPNIDPDHLNLLREKITNIESIKNIRILSKLFVDDTVLEMETISSLVS